MAAEPLVFTTALDVLRVWKEAGLNDAAKLAVLLDPWDSHFNRILRNGLMWAVLYGDNQPDCAMWRVLQRMRDTTVPPVPTVRLIDTRDSKVQYNQVRTYRVLGPDTPQPDRVSVFDAMLVHGLVDQLARGVLDFHGTYTPVGHKTALLTPEQQKTRCWMMEELWCRRDAAEHAFIKALLLHIPCPGNGVFLDVELHTSAKKLDASFYKGKMPAISFKQKAAVRTQYESIPTEDLALAILAVDPTRERVVRIKCKAARKGPPCQAAVFVVATATTLLGEPPLLDTISTFDDDDVLDVPDAPSDDDDAAE